MKIAMIIPYFGRLPSYFQIFLDSCKVNTNYTWIIFSDDNREFEYPPNVQLVSMTFDECRDIIRNKFNFRISLNQPQKLCDFKSAYGYIFSKYLKDFDWWGHCDLDQIFGKINNFISEEMLSRYIKIGSIGHFTIYRNDESINSIFMNSIHGRERYKEVFTCDRCCAFDEWYPDNINEIFLNSGESICLDNYGADIDPYHTVLLTVKYDVTLRKYVYSKLYNSIFVWKNGRVYQNWLNNGQLEIKEYPYIHLQKRKMKDKREKKNGDFAIVPNAFIDDYKNEIELINRNEVFRVINYQYFLVKYSNLRYRIHNNDWNFKNKISK